jgi:hypothetical protein
MSRPRWILLRVYVAPDGECRYRFSDMPDEWPDPSRGRVFRSFVLRVKVEDPAQRLRLWDPTVLKQLVWERWGEIYPHLPHPAVRLGIPP